MLSFCLKCARKMDKKILLIGNPNVGKSVIFNALTGHYTTVSNYPGTTVEVARGTLRTSGGKFEVVDTPGINSFIPTSQDEQVTRDILLKENIYNVILVADAKNLRRSLLLATYLAEMEIPFVLALNMWDEAQDKLISVDIDKLKSILGVQVVPTIATQKFGIPQLSQEIPFPSVSQFKIDYSDEMEEAILRIEKILPSSNISKRGLSIMLLSGDNTLNDFLGAGEISEVENIKNNLQNKYPQPLSYQIYKKRMEAVNKILKEVTRKEELKRSTFSETLGKLSTHPIYGVPMLFFVLYIMYEFVAVFGAQVGVGFLEKVLFGEYINPFLTKLTKTIIPFYFLQDMLVGEYGIITMALTYSLAIVLPVVGTFFIFFSFMEDVGYLPRLSVMSDRIFKTLGLNGKAVLPLVLGLGCGTMATITARILETKKERIIITLLLALCIPCSAQLGVILGMLASISAKATLIFLGVIIFVLILVGFASSLVIKGEKSSFILEIPPLRLPKIQNILSKTFFRMEWYVKEAVPLFIVGTLLLFFLNKLNILKVIEYLATPLVVNFLNLPPKATEAFIVGFLRRDYGAAGLFVLQQKGLLSPQQILVSLITITLFVPCIAQFLIMIKERGVRVAFLIVGFVFPFAFLVGGILNFFLKILGVKF